MADDYEKRLRDLDALLTHAFRLPKHKLSFEPFMKDHGQCYDDGHINVRVINRKGTHFLAWKTVVDTLCHELAHLVHWEHKSAHTRFKSALHVWAQRNGY